MGETQLNVGCFKKASDNRSVQYSSEKYPKGSMNEGNRNKRGERYQEVMIRFSNSKIRVSTTSSRFQLPRLWDMGHNAI